MSDINQLRGKEVLRIPLFIDNYKLPQKEEWWGKCLAHIPWISEEYVVESEQTSPGPFPNVSTVTRVYRRRK